MEEEPDESLVTRAKSGDREAFEALVRRHHRRIYRTLFGITSSHEDAEDLTQATFMKAFQHLGSFQGAARWSTWLTRIAINEGLQRARGRKPVESLDEGGPDDDEEFRPRQVRDWTDTPEQSVSRDEVRALVEKELMQLPEKYRTVVMLRDLEGLSTDDTAQAMGLGIAVVKTRLLRARLMLRERLAPHFTVKREAVRHV
jgi:RNA polymerase sigma-70 factor (ECF subfamily)